MRVLLFPAGILYRGVTGLRNWMYDHRLFKAVKVESKVISIGNLTVGGTGKTPVALALVDMIKARGKTCAVISRGYKREQKGVLEVDTSQSAAASFGDEPALIKHSHPDIPVVVSEKRVLAAKSILESRPVDFMICDDAFQHRSLHRDLNVLLFDATESVKNYRVLPVGLAREALVPALRRADILILTKANLVTPEQAEERVQWLEARCNRPVILAEYIYNGLRSIGGEKRDTLKDPALLVTGVAKPDAVENLAKDHVKIINHRKFADHHRYTDLEVETLLDEASSSGARWIVTTGKDAMKLGAFARLRDRLWVIELGVHFKREAKALDEALDGLARAGN